MTTTNYTEAQRIALNGMEQAEVNAFFDKTARDITEYIALFGEFGIAQTTVWDRYEAWQAA